MAETFCLCSTMIIEYKINDMLLFSKNGVN